MTTGAEASNPVVDANEIWRAMGRLEGAATGYCKDSRNYTRGCVTE